MEKELKVWNDTVKAQLLFQRACKDFSTVCSTLASKNVLITGTECEI